MRALKDVVCAIEPDAWGGCGLEEADGQRGENPGTHSTQQHSLALLEPVWGMSNIKY